MTKSRDPAGSAPVSDRADGTDFIRTIVSEDVRAGRYPEVVTRFPPEPNGFLHIGHAKSICLNFGIAAEYGGHCNLRYDDTNPVTEEEGYVRAIREDVRWLGFDCDDHVHYASDYFERMCGYAETLILRGKAYVDSQSEEEIREGRGTVTTPGTESPFRNRRREENLRLFREMRAGGIADGEAVLRARIDMAHPNMIMRDPILYRVRHASHHRQGDRWRIYPMYDYAHCLEDAIEGVSHSLCTLEFENNREIYDWLLDEVGFTEPRPHQYEFARLNLEHTVLSKRLLLRLVEEGHVAGWDDPRMPTIAALRRRGVPPRAIRAFCDMIGVARSDSMVDVGKLDYQIRDALNAVAPRVMCVLDPLKVVVENFPEGETDWIEAPYYPRDVGREGSRELPFTGELYIDRKDFSADPPKGFRRLAPGREVRLRYGYVIRCDEVVRDSDDGRVRELRCSYDPDTRGGSTPDGRKIRGTIHWVSATHALPAELRLYDRLFARADPLDVAEEEDFRDHLNPSSLVVWREARIEPSVGADPMGTRYQFERMGYYWGDPVDCAPGRLVFNRIVALRDGWSAPAARGEAPGARPCRSRREPPPPEAGRGPRPGVDREEARKRHPDLAARMIRYREEYGLSGVEAEILTGSLDLSDFFERVVSEGTDPRRAAPWIVNELLREIKGRKIEQLPFGAPALARLIALVEAGTISRIAGKAVFSEMARTGEAPEEIVERRSLRAVADATELGALVEEILREWPGKVEEYRGGKKGLMGFFIGRVMEKSGGRADPKLVRELLGERL